MQSPERLSGGAYRALCCEGVWSFGDDDPCDEVDKDAGATGEECDDSGEDANKVEIPSVVFGKGCADSGDHAVLARAGDSRDGGLVAEWWRRRSRGVDGCATGRTEAGGMVDFIAALRAEHTCLRELLFCHIEARMRAFP